jgi:arylsulfatase A-like enzyme
VVGLSACRKASDAPSIVLVVVDTLRADRAPGAASPGVMPALGELARQGWSFEAAVSAAPLTMPSVAALMTGLYPDRTGVITHDSRTRLDAAVSTLAELASNAGYRTAAVVANPWLASRATHFDRGFQRYETRRTAKPPGAKFDAATVTEIAIDLLREADAPLFLWVHYIDTHMPYRPPLEHALAAGNSTGSSAVVRDFVSEAVDRQTIYFQPPYDESELAATRKLYDGAARYADAQIARLLAASDRILGRDASIVIVAADHGESLGEHGLYFAHDFTLYEELAHVPLILRLPGEAPTRFTTPVSLVDVLPTLCERTPIKCPAGLDGVALGRESERGPVFTVGPTARARYARNPFIRVAGIEGRWAAIRRGDDKVVRVPEPGGVRWEAYDLRVDREEKHDVFDARRHRPLKTALESWLVAQRKAARGKPASERSRLERETREDLRALGYLQ